MSWLQAAVPRVLAPRLSSVGAAAVCSFDDEHPRNELRTAVHCLLGNEGKLNWLR